MSDDICLDSISNVSIEGRKGGKKYSQLSSSLTHISNSTAIKTNTKLTPFTLEWAFGVNKRHPVLNLTEPDHPFIFYVCSHAGVLYNYEKREMKLLQGHQNRIAFISSDATGRWLVTADDGEDNVVIVWDRNYCLPIRTLFNPQSGRGPQIGEISPNGKYLVMVCHRPKPSQFGTDISKSNPVVSLWLWTFGKNTCDGEVVLDDSVGTINKITFNPTNQKFFVLTSDKRVIFMTWTKRRLTYQVPELKSSKFVGHFTGTIYQPRTHQALTATSYGSMVVWSTIKHTEKLNPRLDSNDKQFMKIVRLQKEAITVLNLAERIVVTGDVLGRIKFYDHLLRILYWCQSFNLDSLISISFPLRANKYHIIDPPTNSLSSTYSETVSNGDKDNVNVYEEGDEEDESDKDYSEEYEVIYKNMIPCDVSLQQKDFIISDFIVLTLSGKIGVVNILKNKFTPLILESEAMVSAIDVHPERPYLCVGNAMGWVSLYNYDSKERMVTKDICMTDRKTEITCLKYAHTALYIACGFKDGSILFLDSSLLTSLISVPFHNTSSPVSGISISWDGKYLAHKDESFTVSLYYCSSIIDHKWEYYGKYRSHYKPVKDVLFSCAAQKTEKNAQEGSNKMTKDSKLPCLFSLGEDRMLVEYDIKNSHMDHLKILKSHRIEQSAVPLCMTLYPQNSENCRFLISNDQLKYKLFNEMGMCFKTVLNSTLGFPISVTKIYPAIEGDDQERYMIFATDKHIGINMLPIDGNPFKSVSMIGHPVKIEQLCLSPCGKYLFTRGQDDFSVLVWGVNINAVDVMARIGGEGLEPYYCLIEGGQSGTFFEQMKEFFYYTQILHQGENATVERNISEKTQLSVIPDLMRAVGYYPSEYEVESLLREVITKAGPSSNENILVSFEEFVQLYINHRPAFGVSEYDLIKHFNNLQSTPYVPEPSMPRNHFLSILQNKGECFTREQVLSYISIFIPDRVMEAAEDESEDHAGFIPQEISYNVLVHDILGLTFDDSSETISVASTNTTEQEEQELADVKILDTF